MCPRTVLHVGGFIVITHMVYVTYLRVGLQYGLEALERPVLEGLRHRRHGPEGLAALHLDPVLRVDQGKHVTHVTEHDLAVWKDGGGAAGRHSLVLVFQNLRSYSSV